MRNINAILTRTKKNRDFFMLLPVLNEPPAVQYAANVFNIKMYFLVYKSYP